MTHEKKKGENATEASSKTLTFENATAESLKPKRKILKKKKAKGNLQGQGERIEEKKSEPTANQPTNNNEIEDGKELETRDRDEQKNTANEKHVNKSQQNNKRKQKVAGLEKAQQSQKNKEKHGSQPNEKRKEKHGSQPNEKKKEKLGGLVFMCSAKTKPDCFRYRVMGVSMSKKDLVLSIKPGLKLFLYDFDLKLMYGIYQASSAGGMKLEPAAFGGNFPAQVRFNVYKDCYPLPESVFKKAIKENYNERHKFKIELTVQQVRKLTELFRPAEIHSSASTHQSPPRAIIRHREVYEGARESLPRSQREPYARDTFVNGDARSYTALSHERDQRIVYGEVTLKGKEEFPRDSFLTEKEYRTYGLRRDTRHLTPPSHMAPALEPYRRDQEGEHLLRPTAPVYIDSATARREPAHHDPLFLKEEEYRIYGLGARQELPSPIPPATTTTFSSYRKEPYYARVYDRQELPSPIPPATASTLSTLGSSRKDPYYAHEYGASSVDPYPPPPRREEVAYSLSGRRETYLSESNDLRRREADETERYSRYASDALSDYNQRQHYQGARLDPAAVPVSSRYSFAGPSSYR